MVADGLRCDGSAERDSQHGLLIVGDQRTVFWPRICVVPKMLVPRMLSLKSLLVSSIGSCSLNLATKSCGARTNRFGWSNRCWIRWRPTRGCRFGLQFAEQVADDSRFRPRSRLPDRRVSDLAIDSMRSIELRRRRWARPRPTEADIDATRRQRLATPCGNRDCACCAVASSL